MSILQIAPAILLVFLVVSCNEVSMDGIESVIIKNDTLIVEQNHVPIFYPIDFDEDGEDDVSLGKLFEGSVAGNNCSIWVNILNSNFKLHTTTALDSICQDTLYSNLDTEYFEQFNCAGSTHFLRIDTTEIGKIYSNVDFVETGSCPLNSEDSITFLDFTGMGAHGIFPGAIFLSIHTTAFQQKEEVETVYFVFETTDNQLFAIKLTAQFGYKCANYLVVEEILSLGK